MASQTLLLPPGDRQHSSRLAAVYPHRPLYSSIHSLIGITISCIPLGLAIYLFFHSVITPHSHHSHSYPASLLVIPTLAGLCPIAKLHASSVSYETFAEAIGGGVILASGVLLATIGLYSSVRQSAMESFSSTVACKLRL
ncbi:MAG: hypothetical protein AAF974_11135 [Cyanobacteria bacterium P01_E01_bin.34]